MLSERDRNWELAKAQLIEMEAAYLTLALHQEPTDRGLRARIREHIDDLHGIVQEMRAKAAGLGSADN